MNSINYTVDVIIKKKPNESLKQRVSNESRIHIILADLALHTVVHMVLVIYFIFIIFT